MNFTFPVSGMIYDRFQSKEERVRYRHCIKMPSADGGNMPDNLRVRIGSVASAAGKLRSGNRSRMSEAEYETSFY
jgi:hypothetical protein